MSSRLQNTNLVIFPKKNIFLQAYRARLQATMSLFSIEIPFHLLPPMNWKKLVWTLWTSLGENTHVGHSLSNMQKCNVNLHNTDASGFAEIVKFALASKKAT